MQLVATSGKATLLNGMLENIVYFGTDTHYHVQLNGGGQFTVRQQSMFTHGRRELCSGRHGRRAA